MHTTHCTVRAWYTRVKNNVQYFTIHEYTSEYWLASVFLYFLFFYCKRLKVEGSFSSKLFRYSRTQYMNSKFPFNIYLLRVLHREHHFLLQGNQNSTNCISVMLLIGRRPDTCMRGCYGFGLVAKKREATRKCWGSILRDFESVVSPL